MSQSIRLLLSCALSVLCTATPIILTVQTQSQQQMHNIATQDAQRRLLGAMEATQSSVVDVENVDALLYDITNVQKVQPIPADMRLRISIGKPNFVFMRGFF